MRGDRQRQAILAALRAAPGGLDTLTLAGEVQLHPNTVRWHLDALTASGQVTSEPSREGARGRPRLVHRATYEEGGARDDYLVLAELLAAALQDTPAGLERAYATGADFGRRLRRAAPTSAPEELLDHQGFAARRRASTIEMRRCPFLELAERSPETVCTLHRGMIDGALVEAGSAERVRKLDVLVKPGLCRAVLGGTE
jgi:predicted ArsR family transcriptional regulator